MIHDFNLQESFEISPRFRRTIEERIDRLERDAEWDEAQVRASGQPRSCPPADAPGGGPAR